MLRVLYAFPEPLPLPRARGVQAIHTVDALARQGMSVILAYVPAGDTDPFSAYGLAIPETVQLLPLSRSLPWPLSRVHSNRLFVLRLLAALRAAPLKPDALVVRHLKLAWLMIRQDVGIPLLYEAHEVFGETGAEKKRERLQDMEREVMSRAAALVANSRATAARLRERYGLDREIAVIPNGVAVPASVPEKNWADCARRIVYSGSFFEWKGVQDLVTAARELPGCAITLVGGTAEQIEHMRKLAAPGGAVLEFAGMKPHREVMAELLGACIAVLPNRADTDSAFTSPIKLFEYMAAGCAVVASDLPSVREVLGPGEAVWVRPGDPRSLAEGIRQLTADPARAQAMGERLRAKARDYAWEARGARLAEVLAGAAGAVVGANSFATVR